MSDKNIVLEAEEVVFDMFKNDLPEKLVYHNFLHTQRVAKDSKKIASKYDLSSEELEELLLAAWFHDVGYLTNYKDHENESIRICRKFLEQRNYDKKGIENITKLIFSTKPTQVPQTLSEEILHDADILSVGKKSFFTQAELIRIEWESFLDKRMTDVEWEQQQLDFLLNHKFFTKYIKSKYDTRKKKNIEKQKAALTKKIAKYKKSSAGGRGTETMYRAVYRNHINLSSMADSKANMMISINTVILSVIIAVVGSGFTFSGKDLVEHIRFTIPMCILVLGSLISVVFAVLSASPNITNKQVSKQRIEKNKASVLFFGNYISIELPDFLKRMQQLRDEKTLLYDNMSVDIYFLGIVLEKKYKLLKMSYITFLGALVLCVAAFLAIFFLTVY